MTKLKQRWRKISSSFAFKLGVYYSFSGLVLILFLLGFIYLQVMGALHGHHFRQVNSMSKRVNMIYEVQGRDGVVAFIKRELSSYTPASAELFYMKGAHGQKVIGNVDYIPADFFSDDYLSEVRLYQDGRHIDARLQKLHLGDEVVFVGRNLNELVYFKNLIGRSSLITALLALVLSGISTYWFLFELRSGAQLIRKTAAQIRAGSFKERIPIRGQDDEVSLLSQELNLMLDHMESSLNGVRYVSDTIAHNLRTPLMRIMSILRPLQHKNASSDELKVGVSHVLAEIEGLTRLFDKLLYVSEIESGLQRRSLKEINLSDLVLDIGDLYMALAEESAIDFQLHVQKNIYVMGDSDLIASALSNLLENALKYTNKKIVVRLYLDKHSSENKEMDCYCLRVCDDGRGVSADSLDKLGQHFYRDSTDNKVSGTGLGLTSVIAIMRLHQGRVEFGNKEKGFSVCLQFPQFRENHEGFYN